MLLLLTAYKNFVGSNKFPQKSYVIMKYIIQKSIVEHIILWTMTILTILDLDLYLDLDIDGLEV